MRILITADPPIPVPPTRYGGIERIVDGLIDGYLTAGHEVQLIAHPKSRSDVPLWPWPTTATGAYAVARQAMWLAYRAREFKPDIIHSFSRLMLLLLPMLGRQRIVMSFQREPTVRTVATASRIAGDRLRFTGCSNYIATLGRRAGGRWSAIPNFVDTTAFAAPACWPGADAPLLFLSKVFAFKGTAEAIAIAKAANRQLIIAGNVGQLAHEQQYWTEHVAPHVDGTTIRYVGPVDDAEKIALLQACAAMLVPIQWDEPFGIVFAEALACGAPVISTPRGALPEIVRDGVDGFLIESLEQGVAAVARLDEIDRNQCRQRALAFSRQAIVPRYIELFESMLADD